MQQGILLCRLYEMKHISPIIDADILHQILFSSADPILITSKNANIVYVNPAWEKLTGYKMYEVLGKNPNILQSGKTSRVVYKSMWKALTSGRPFTSDKVIDKKKNGNEYQVRSFIYPILKDGKVYLYVQRQLDITAEKRLEKLRRDFLSVSAHELKTPITVLKLLTQSSIHNAEKKHLQHLDVNELQLIDQELDRLTRLINDMLDSSRVEMGKFYMVYEEIDLGDLIKETATKIQVYAQNHKIVIGSLAQARVIADRGRLEQVLLNLLSNAVKYSQEGTTITIASTAKDNEVIVSVQDQGIGIPKNKQKLIFDRYYQVKAKSKVGFGLGLYLSKEIIKRHKGKIWATSMVGQGSTFSFSLPLRTKL